MRTVALLLTLVISNSAYSRPIPHDRYEEDEPCEAYVEPYFECRTNTDLYFPSCRKKKGDDYLSCLFKRGGGLMLEDPLAYMSLPSDPKGVTAIRQYRKSEQYADRLSFLKDDKKYFEDYTFCFESRGSKFRWKYNKEKGILAFKVRSFASKKYKIANVPVENSMLQFKVDPAVAGYFLEKRNTRPVIFFRFTKEVVEGALEIILTDISFCRGRNCKPEFTISPDGRVEK